MQRHYPFTANDPLKFKLYSLALITISLLVFTILGANMKVKQLSFTAPTVPQESNVTLIVDAVSVDPMERTITMDWYPSFTSYIDCSGNWFPVYDINVDPTLLDNSSPTFHDAPPYPALARLNKSEDCIGTNLGIPGPSFRTVTKLVSSTINDARSPFLGNLQGYPFDVYIAPFIFFVTNVDTGDIFSPNITKSSGVVVNFQMSLSSSLVISDRFDQERLYFVLRIERSKAIKMYSVIVAVTNWLIATAFLIICASTLVYNVSYIYAEIFVVPVGALFAFTSVRTNLPGAPPGFGTTMDLYSTLPVLVLISLCSVFLLLTILLWRINELRKTLNDKEITLSENSSTTTDDTKRSIGNSVYYRTFVKSTSHIKRNTVHASLRKPIQYMRTRQESHSSQEGEPVQVIQEELRRESSKQ